MALYAFDGTWNRDKPDADRDTNVMWFCEAYQERVFYVAGVGTRFGELGRIAGGVTGAGGRARVKEARQALGANFKTGDTTIDIVGFSRGAALALHFANQIAMKGVAGHPGVRSIRFLGLWDTVPSFGLPSVPANIGWDLDLPENVQMCFHALALDERRHTFRLHRLEARVTDAAQHGRLVEVWFRGVHSDVGGGNRNPALSSIALNWMFANARRHGLPIDPARVAENGSRIKPQAEISVHSFDPIKSRFRIVRPTDRAHGSVAFRPDTKERQHNNPPASLVLVDDDGLEAGRFARMVIDSFASPAVARGGRPTV